MGVNARCAADVATAKRAGALVPCEKPSTIADGLQGGQGETLTPTTMGASVGTSHGMGPNCVQRQLGSAHAVGHTVWYSMLRACVQKHLSVRGNFISSLSISGRLGDLTWPVVSALVDGVLVVTEEEIVAAMRHVYERMKVGEGGAAVRGA